MSNNKPKLKYRINRISLEREPHQEPSSYVKSINGGGFTIEGLKWEELTFTVKYVSSGDYSAITSEKIISKFTDKIKVLKFKSDKNGTN